MNEPYAREREEQAGWLPDLNTKGGISMNEEAEVIDPYLVQDEYLVAALKKFAKGYANATDDQKRRLLIILHDEFGLSRRNIRQFIRLRSGQMEYQWWKLVRGASKSSKVG